MKSLLIIITLVFLSCKEKDTTITKADLAVTEVINVLNSNPEKPIAFEESAQPTETVDESFYVNSTLYKGTLNSNIKIRLYINEQENPCGGNLRIIEAMYKYDNQEKWILLSVIVDNSVMAENENKKYCMVEDNFSGVLFLEENESFLNGNWISPDTKKQFKVALEKVISDKSDIEKLNEILFDDLIYGKNDC